MPQTGRIWLLVRLGLMAVGLLQSSWTLASLSDNDFSHPSWSFAFEMTASIAIGLVAVIGLQAFRDKHKWLKPSWFQNPFSFTQPILLFDAASCYVLAIAVGCAVLGMARVPRNWAWQLLLSIGAGLWIGTRDVNPLST